MFEKIPIRCDLLRIGSNDLRLPQLAEHLLRVNSFSLSISLAKSNQPYPSLLFALTSPPSSPSFRAPPLTRSSSSTLDQHHLETPTRKEKLLVTYFSCIISSRTKPIYRTNPRPLHPTKFAEKRSSPPSFYSRRPSDPPQTHTSPTARFPIYTLHPPYEHQPHAPFPNAASTRPGHLLVRRIMSRMWRHSKRASPHPLRLSAQGLRRPQAL